MRTLFILFILLKSVVALMAQVQVLPGTQMVVEGTSSLIIENLDFQQDGTFTADQATVILRGASSSIRGVPTHFHKLLLDKSGGTLQLQTLVGVNDSLSFGQGMLDLNGQQLDLGTTGLLHNERETSRAYSSAPGGIITSQAVLNAPNGENPGKLGAEITSAANLGATTLIRGHDAQSVGTASSILRYYDILPATNAGLNATLRFHYLDAELNGATEAELELFLSSDNGANWSPASYATRDANLNFVEQTGLERMGRWTSTVFRQTSFPVEWLGFDAWPKEQQVFTQWLTASEVNSDYFEVQRSANGLDFEGFTQVAAAGNSQEVRVYEARDPTPLMGRSYYRVKQVDLGGAFTYSPSVQVYVHTDLQLRLFPNPANEQTWLDLMLQEKGSVGIQLSDMRGKVVLQNTRQFEKGSYRIPLDVSQLSEGVYTLRIQTSRTTTSLRLMVE